MTDQTEGMPEPQWAPEPEPGDWGDAHPLAARPQGLDSDTRLANHVYTISYTPKGQPMVVVRANTAAEMRERLAALYEEGAYMHLAEAQRSLVNAAPPAETIVRELQAQPVQQQGYPQQPVQGYGSPVAQAAVQQYPTPQNGFAGPPMPSPGQPPFGAPAGGYAPPQPQWGGGGNQPPQRPQGWYAVKIPFAQKDAGDQVKQNLKNMGLYQGNVKWESETKTWLVSPQVAQYFQQWNPLPA